MPNEGIDEARLERDVAYRFDDLAEVVGFTERDRALIRAARPALRARIDPIVGRISEVILARPAMRRHFASGPGAPEAALVSRHLRAWIEGLLQRARAPDLPLWLDRVGASRRSRRSRCRPRGASRSPAPSRSCSGSRTIWYNVTTEASVELRRGRHR